MKGFPTRAQLQYVMDSTTRGGEMFRLEAFVVLAMLECAVTGCGGSSVNVNGTVSYFGIYPAGAVTVLLADASNLQTTVKTDATGAFSVTGVSTPYSATVVTPALPQALIEATASVYLGLTRADPALSANVFPPLPGENGGTLDVTVSGGTYPQPATDYTTNFTFASPQTSQVFALTGAIGAENSLDVSWYGPAASTGGTLSALQVQSDDSGLPVAYPGYGMTSASLTTPGETSVSLALNPVSSAVLTGSVTLPPGFHLLSIEGQLGVPNSALAPDLFLDSTQPATFSYVMPSIAGTTLSISALATAAENVFWLAAAAGLAADASAVSLDCAGPPTLLSPADGQTGVTTATAFSWSAYPNAVYRLLLGTLTVWTASKTLTLPDLSSVNFQVAPSTQYTWQVSASAPYASIDALAAPQATAMQAQSLFCEADSLPRSFTTSATP
jgi:hypothetical protein